MSKSNIIVSDTLHLNLPRAVVWEKLNDPAILAQCIQGCTHVDKQSNHFTAVIRARFAGYHKDFNVDLTVADSLAPESYQLTSQVAAGFLGSAGALTQVQLTALETSQTELYYRAELSAQGLLAKGLPLLGNKAEKRVRAFFSLFKQAAAAANDANSNISASRRD